MLISFEILKIDLNIVLIKPYVYDLYYYNIKLATF